MQLKSKAWVLARLVVPIRLRVFPTKCLPNKTESEQNELVIYCQLKQNKLTQLMIESNPVISAASDNDRCRRSSSKNSIKAVYYGEYRGIDELFKINLPPLELTTMNHGRWHFQSCDVWPGKLFPHWLSDLIVHLDWHLAHKPFAWEQWESSFVGRTQLPSRGIPSQRRYIAASLKSIIQFNKN